MLGWSAVLLQRFLKEHERQSFHIIIVGVQVVKFQVSGVNYSSLLLALQRRFCWQAGSRVVRRLSRAGRFQSVKFVQRVSRSGDDRLGSY